MEGGPLFFYIADELGYVNNYIVYGNVVDVAKELNGIVYGIETRYFSHADRPTGNLSLDNLKYLTIDQTINDYAVIINYIRQELPTSDRVIIYGYGHGGRIATWLKQHNPILIDGAYAMSAPLNVEVEFEEYLEDIAGLFLNESAITNAGRCGERIGLAFYELVDIIESGDATRINSIFNLSEPLDASDSSDVGLFFVELIRMITVGVEYTT